MSDDQKLSREEVRDALDKFDVPGYLRRHPIDVPQWATALRGYPRAIMIAHYLAAFFLSIIGVVEIIKGERRTGVFMLFMAIFYAAVSCVVWMYVRSRLRFQYVAESYIEEMLENVTFREQESEKARAAASVRHEANRKRNAEARELYEGREWPTKAAAARALATKFHVTQKTSERWILSWGKE